MDQCLLAAPHGLSQRATSFIASWRQGIRQTPFFALELRPRTNAIPHARRHEKPRLPKARPPARSPAERLDSFIRLDARKPASTGKPHATAPDHKPKTGARDPTIELVLKTVALGKAAKPRPDGQETPSSKRDCSQSTYDYTTRIPRARQGLNPAKPRNACRVHGPLAPNPVLKPGSKRHVHGLSPQCPKPNPHPSDARMTEPNPRHPRIGQTTHPIRAFNPTAASKRPASGPPKPKPRHSWWRRTGSNR